MDAEAWTAVRQAPVSAAKALHDDLGIWPRKIIGDTGYGLAETLAWPVHERGLAASEAKLH